MRSTRAPALVVFVLFASAACRGEEPDPEPGRATAVAAPPPVRFTDVTIESGIDFVPENGARGEKLLPETMGGGAAFFDYDGDGDPDLLLVNSAPWPHDEATGPPPTPRLYENDGRGRFADVTEAAGLAVSFYGMGAATADYDGDGRVDVLFTAVGRNRLFRNLGGRFEETTDAAGVGGDPDLWGTGAGFFDADLDGDLDLLVLRYIRWSRDVDLKVNFTLNGRDRAYGPPNDYEGAHPLLYRNDGDGTFTETAAAAGLHVVDAAGKPAGKSLGQVFFDHDRDGDLDVFVANDTVRNFLFENRGDGTFEETGVRAGFAFDPMGNATGAMGIDAAWIRNAGAPAVAVGNFANEATSLCVRQAEAGLFVDEAATAGVAGASRTPLTFGVLFLDVDLDGRPDLIQANGHLDEEIGRFQPGQRYRQSAQLFWNAGPGAPREFVSVPESDATRPLFTPIVGRGAATADVDRDGDPDLLVTQIGGRPLLLRNDQATGRNWLAVKLVGPTGNRDAIGAEVEVTAGDLVQRQVVSPTRGYLSQSDPELLFGLNDRAVIDRIEVRWPDGRTEFREAVPASQRLTISYNPR